MPEKEEPVLDPDFSEKEHEEFERLERENPYREIQEEKIRLKICVFRRKGLPLHPQCRNAKQNNAEVAQSIEH